MQSKELLELEIIDRPTTAPEDFNHIQPTEEWLKTWDLTQRLSGKVDNMPAPIGTVNRARDLGWDVGVGSVQDPRLYYIVDKEIPAPKTDYVYHGTATQFFSSIQEKGLNNGLGKELNPGAMSVQDGVTYSADFNYANSYSKISAAKTHSSSMVLRWKEGEPKPKNEIGATTNTIKPEDIQFSLDGATWYPLDKVKLSKDKRGSLVVTPIKAVIENVSPTKVTQSSSKSIFSNLFKHESTLPELQKTKQKLETQLSNYIKKYRDSNNTKSELKGKETKLPDKAKEIERKIESVNKKINDLKGKSEESPSFKRK